MDTESVFGVLGNGTASADNEANLNAASIAALSNKEPVTLHAQENVPFSVPNFLADFFKPNLSATRALHIAKLVEDNRKKIVGRIWQKICKNCYFAGKGLRGHRLPECQVQGNKCLLVCSRCYQGLHWAPEGKGKGKK